MAEKTTSHEQIRRWVEDRGGRPVRVEGTGGNGDGGLLRIDFGAKEENLEPVDWDTWFETFDENDLAFLYESDGESRFNKLVSR